MPRTASNLEADGERTSIAVATPAGRPLHRQRDFGLLWMGQGVSQLGTQVSVVALPMTAVVFLHASAGEMGLLNTMVWLPFLLFGLIVGAYTDRLPRRFLLICADVGRAAVLAAVVGLAWLGSLTMPVLVILAFVLGSLTVVFDVSYLAYLPSLVHRDQLVGANSRLQATASAAQVAGPGIGGLLVQLLSASTALLADAISYVASVAGLLAIRAQEDTARRSQSSNERVISQVGYGIRFTYQNPVLRALIGVAGTYNLFDQWILTLFMLYALHDLHLSAGAVGLVLSGGATGALLGSIVASSSIQRLGLGRTLLYSVVLECLALLALPAIHAGHPVTIALLALAFGLNGVGVAISSVAAVSVRQAATPAQLLGRMTASYRSVSYGTIALGAALGGLAGQLVGLRSGIAIGALGMASTIAWVVFSPLPRLRKIAEVEQPGADG